MTLRLRLLLVLVGIVAAGLLITDVAIYNSLGSFLDNRVDQQLDAAAGPVSGALASCAELSQFGPIGGGPSLDCNQFVRIRAGASIPPGTFGELRDANGSLVGQAAFFFAGGGGIPRLPASLPGASSSSAATGVYFSTRSTTGHPGRYRVLAQPLAQGGTLVVAIPLTEVDLTLGRLVLIEGLVTAAMLVTLGSLSWWIVRRGLRPLGDMATTAGAIAAGDLSQRIQAVGGGTEVGQLGEALNAMLGNIEQAFAARAASEERLRRFLADASHELRTPLTSIRGYAEMFDRGARDRPEDLATSMHQIRSEADRMSELVNDLLLLARLDHERPIEREAVDVTYVVEEAVDALRVSVPDRDVTLSMRGPAVVNGDAHRLRQVADNLLTNAVRHTPPGGPVEVRVRVEYGAVVVEVADRGPGIPLAEQAHIFEPFHRADPSRARQTGGVGLGLAIVAAIVRAHGGVVGVDSDGEHGSTFWVRIPSRAAVSSPTESTAASSAAQSTATPAAPAAALAPPNGGPPAAAARSVSPGS